MRRKILRAIVLTAALGLVLGTLGAVVVFAQRDAARAQAPPRSSMDQRLDQLISVLQTDPGCPAVTQAIDESLEILYGGLRPLPSKGLLEQTQAADANISQAEMRLAGVLDQYSKTGGCNDQRGRALDLKLFIEQMNEVAEAVGRFTAGCGPGDSMSQPNCAELHRGLNESTGKEDVSGTHIATVTEGYSVKLHGPYIPFWFGGWEEDVRVTSTIPNGQCATILKETKGLMVRLTLKEITVVQDPWVSTFGVPRGTLVPIWVIEWVPSEYVKVWSLCNINGKIRQTELQRVKQDIPLNYVWRYYHKDP